MHFAEEDITHSKPHQLIQKGIVYVPQKNNSFDQLTVNENLEVAATHLHNKAEVKQRLNSVFAKLPQLAPLNSRTPFHLSGGEKQQLALGMALMQHPKMILLDEPGAGLAPHTWQQNLEIIKTLIKVHMQGLTVRPELVEGGTVKPIMVRQAHHERLNLKLSRLKREAFFCIAMN